MRYEIPDHILEKSDALAREGRIIGGVWRRGGGDGGTLEAVCALASWENGQKINATSDCPNTYAPKWLIELIPTLDDGLPDDAARSQFVLGLNERARQWPKLGESAWDKVRVEFLTFCIQRALASAERVQPTPRPAYWDQVQDICGQMIVALKGGGSLEAAAVAWAVARAAAAARAAGAAEAAAAARAAAAAAMAAGAAAAAARAAAEAAGAAGAAEAAEAFQSLVSDLFTALDQELNKGTET